MATIDRPSCYLLTYLLTFSLPLGEQSRMLTYFLTSTWWTVSNAYLLTFLLPFGEQSRMPSHLLTYCHLVNSIECHLSYLLTFSLPLGEQSRMPSYLLSYFHLVNSPECHLTYLLTPIWWTVSNAILATYLLSYFHLVNNLECHLTYLLTPIWWTVPNSYLLTYFLTTTWWTVFRMASKEGRLFNLHSSHLIASTWAVILVLRFSIENNPTMFTNLFYTIINLDSLSHHINLTAPRNNLIYPYLSS